MCSERKENLSPALKAALDVLSQWRGKKACLLQGLNVDEGSTEAATEIEEEEDKIFKVDMTTIDGALEVLVHAAVQDLGPIARDVFRAIFWPEEAREERMQAFTFVTYEHLQELSRMFQQGTISLDETISHRIVAVNPVAPSPDDLEYAYRCPADKWTIDYRSVSIAREMAEKLEEEEDARLGKFFRLFRSAAQLSTFASWILENIANCVLHTNARQNLVLVEMHGDRNDDAPVLHVDFKTDVATEGLQLPGGDRVLVPFEARALNKLTDMAYYVPRKSNFPLFDSFLFERRASETAAELILWVFRMSTSPTHGGSREGYISIRRIIESLKSSFGTTEDADGKKTKKQNLEFKITVNYVYVTPWEKNHTEYQWRCPSGWNKHATIHDHRGKFYCLRMPIPSGTSA